MSREIIPVPEKGTYRHQLFAYWSDEYRSSRAQHAAYIALNFAGALDSGRAKMQRLIQAHRERAQASKAHQRALARLGGTLTGAALAYEQAYR